MIFLKCKICFIYVGFKCKSKKVDNDCPCSPNVPVVQNSPNGDSPNDDSPNVPVVRMSL